MPTLTYTTGIVDTMLREATPTQSYGTAGTLSVDNDDAGTGFDKQALLQFTGLFGTASNQIPYGARITSAALTLQSTDAGDGVALHRMLTSWTGAATWAGFGGNGIQAGSEAAASADLTTGRLGTLGATSFDVTASVQAWSNGALNYGWAFLPLGSNGWSFSSAEGATPPSLTVTYGTTSTSPPSIQASVVRVHNAWQYSDGGTKGYGNADPSGLAYVPGLNTLFIADSEHDESPFYSSTNLFAVRPDGSYVGRYSLASFTKEPTGLAHNPKNGLLYITDDNLQEVFWVNPANPSVKVGQFDTGRFGLTDTEDPKFDPVTGNMFVLDGALHKLFEFTAQGSLVKSMSLPSVMKDAEALAYDPTYDVFFVASGASTNIWEMSRTGQILSTIDVLGSSKYVNPVTGVAPAPKGLELAPSSNPNDGHTMSLFVADYGVDQKNDGRLFEISLGSSWLIA